MKKDEQPKKKRRQRNERWQRIYGVDRRYTARVDRARERGQYTEPGTRERTRE